MEYDHILKHHERHWYANIEILKLKIPRTCTSKVIIIFRFKICGTAL